MITPIPVPDVAQHSLYYQLSWGAFGILLGHALPAVDAFWEDSISPVLSESEINGNSKSTAAKPVKAVGSEDSSFSDSGTGPMWYSAVRSVGAFVGIAFAVVSKFQRRN